MHESAAALCEAKPRQGSLTLEFSRGMSPERSEGRMTSAATTGYTAPLRPAVCDFKRPATCSDGRGWLDVWTGLVPACERTRFAVQRALTR